jgi:hypothetical protein
MWVKKIISMLMVIPGCFLLSAQENSLSLHFQEALNFSRFQKMRSPFSVVANPSVLAHFSSNSWALSAEKRMAIPGWVQAYGIGLLSSSAGNWALAGETSGLEGFRRQQLAISHARKLANGISVGLSMGACSYKATGYKVQWNPFFSIGGLMELSEVLSMGFTGSATFLNRSTTEKTFSPNWQFLFTLHYEPSAKVCVAWWSAKKTNVSVNSGFSFKYLLKDNISLLGGLAINQQLSWFGVSLQRKKIVINLQAGWHSMLGVSNNIFLYGHHN